MVKRFVILWICLCFPVMMMGQEENKKRSTGVGRVIHKVLSFIDTMAVRGNDPRYIEIPERPWAVVARTTLSSSFITLKSENEDNLLGKVKLRSNTDLTTSVGAWIGYRGYGFGYSFDVSGDKGTNFSTGASNFLDLLPNLNLGAMGGHYGLNLRIRSYKVNKSYLSIWGDGNDPLVQNTSFEISEPMKVRSVFADAYYMFNGKRFSYAAAYDQSAIQIRSAGSLVAGLMYHYSRVKYDSEDNLLLLDYMEGVGQMKVWQGSVGAGYAYNWVPGTHWLLSVMFLPMLTLYNRAEVVYYERTNPDSPTDMSVHETGSEMTRNRIIPNLDTRFSITYNRAQYYLNGYVTYNSFRYTYDGGSVRLGDWYAYFSWGLRF